MCGVFSFVKEVRTIATVDSLDIQISASVNTAVASLRHLNVQLNTLGTGLRNIGLTTNASFSRISESSRKLTEGFQKINKPVNALTNGLKKTVKQLGKVAIATVGIQKSIKNSMDFIETLNYFDRAFEQVASNADLSAFSEMGYKSAEEYFNSFSERAKELTAKMSGFNVNVDGTLTTSGMPSLGIDPDKLMNYQAMFGQMASSMGVASETSLKLSNALTMIGADLASVKNMKFEKVWEDMASGLAGMSRTLDKYGANIRNVNLQQKLTELGINANVQALNQNDKALLRGIILLDSTRFAWGDLANTLNQPANQWRLIEGNIQNLSRTIGNLFLPVLAKVLPYINGFVIALQRLFTWLGRIFKIDLSNLMPKGGGGGSGAISDLIGDTGALEDGLNAATAAAKKLNKQVRAFDELSVINTSSGGAGGAGAGGIGSGLLDDAFNEAYQEYLDAWNDAFANVEDRAQGIADKIQAFFKDLFKPIAAAWDSEGNRVMVGWKRALQEVGKLAKDIGRDFMTMWQQQGTVDIFKDIFHIIGDIGFIVGNLAENFRIAWNTNEVGLHIFENIRDVIGAVTKNIRKAADYTVQWSKTLDFYPILSSIQEWTKSLVPVFDALSGMVSDFYTQALLPLGKWTLEKGLPSLLDVATDLNKSIDWNKIRKSLQGLNKELVKIGKFTFTGAVDFIGKFLSPIAKWTMNKALPTLVETITDFSKRIKWDVLNENLRKFWEGLSRFAVGIGDGLLLFFKSVSPFFTSALAAVINGVGSALGALGDALNRIPIEIAQMLGGAIGGVLTVFAAHQAIGVVISGISAALEGLSAAFAVLAANPLTAIAAGIAGVAGALIAFEESWDAKQNNLWETEQIKQYGDTLDNIKQKYQDFSDSIALNSQTRLDHVGAVSSVEVPYLDTIAEKYFTLSEKTNLSAQEYGELKLAAQKLVENFPQLQQYYDDTTGLIDVERGAIEDLIKAKEAELTLNAISDEWTAAIKDQIEAQKNLDEASKNLNDALAEQEEKLKPIQDALEKNSDANVSEFQPAYAEATEKVETFTTAVNEAEKALNDVTGEISYYESAYSQALEKIPDKAGEYGKSVADNFTGSFSEEIEASKDTVQGAVNSAFSEENVVIDTTPLGNIVVEGITTTITDSDLSTPMTTKINEMSDAANEALGGVPSTVFGGFGEGVITGLTDAIDSNFNTPISRLQDLASDMKAVFDNIYSEFHGFGVNIMQGLLDGLSSLESTVYSKMQSITDSIAKIPKTGWDIHSPSKVFYGLGNFAMEGLKEGLENLYTPIKNSLQGFVVSDLQIVPEVFSNFGQFEPMPPPEFDFESRRQGVYEIAAEVQRENSRAYSNSDGYDNYSEEVSLLMSQNQLLRRQNELLQAILDKPTLDSDSLYTNFVQKSMERGGNAHGGRMNRLAVAQELYR